MKDIKYCYCIVDKVESYIEDFIDEDTNEVVSIERINVIKSYLAYFVDIKCSIKKHKFELISAYIKANSKYFRLNMLLTTDKYLRIRHGKIKKYSSLEVIKLF